MNGATFTAGVDCPYTSVFVVAFVLGAVVGYLLHVAR